MLKFKKINANPKGRKTSDCSTRALSNILEITYEEALRLQCEMSIKKCYGLTSKENLEWILKEHGWIKMKQPRKDDNTKYQVCEMDEILTKEQMTKGVFVIVASHCTIVRGGCIEDTWNCGYKTIGNYWIKY